MTDYSGIELVKQERCKLTYATFLTDIINCYDKTGNRLVLHNPYSFETQYNELTKTVYNSAFELSAVDIDLSSDITAFKLVLNLANTATGLKLILKAGGYKRTRIIPEGHLTLCDTYDNQDCLDLPEVQNDTTEEDLKIIMDKTLQNKRFTTLDTFLSLLDCYDPVTKELSINNPYYKSTRYDSTEKKLFAPVFSLSGLNLLVCPDALKLVLKVPGSIDIHNVHVLIKTVSGWVDCTFDLSTINQCPSTNCYDEGELNSNSYIKPCQKVLYNNTEISPCYSLKKPNKVDTDSLSVVTSCTSDKVCTDFGCVPRDLYGSPCGQQCNALGYTLAPVVMVTFNSFMHMKTFITDFSIYPNGDVFGQFKSAFNHGSIVSIRFFNYLDYIVPNVYTDGSVTKTVDIMYYIATKFLNLAPATAWGLATQRLDVNASQLSQIFTSITSATFDWTASLNMAVAPHVTTNIKPCEYLKIHIHNNEDGSTEIINNYLFSNNSIPGIEATGLDFSNFIIGYNKYSEKVKWLISDKAYAYAVYQGYLDPDTPITY